MIALYIILGIIAFITLVLMIPIGVSLVYDDSLNAILLVGPFRFPLYPPKPKKKKPEKQKKSKEEEASAEEEAPTEQKKASKGDNPVKTFYNNNGIDGVIDLFERVMKQLGGLFKRILRAFIIDELYLDMIVARGDAAQTAAEYGRMCASVFPAFGLITSTMRVRKYDVRIEPDFLGRYDEFTLTLRLHFHPLTLINAVILTIFGFVNHVILKYLFDGSFSSGSKKHKKASSDNKRSVSLTDSATEKIVQNNAESEN